MIDVYGNLPIKIAGLLNWMHKNCANFKQGFLLKVDDDAYLSVRTREYFIHEITTSIHSVRACLVAYTQKVLLRSEVYILRYVVFSFYYAS